MTIESPQPMGTGGLHISQIASYANQLLAENERLREALELLGSYVIMDESEPIGREEKLAMGKIIADALNGLSEGGQGISKSAAPATPLAESDPERGERCPVCNQPAGQPHDFEFCGRGAGIVGESDPERGEQMPRIGKATPEMLEDLPPANPERDE